MLKLLATPLLIGLLAAPALAASEADPSQLDVDRIVRSHPDMPKRGVHMDAVRANLGEPNKAAGPVGEPPITRWVYDDFTVYFEHQRVLHSVIPRSND